MVEKIDQIQIIVSVFLLFPGEGMILPVRSAPVNS